MGLSGACLGLDTMCQGRVALQGWDPLGKDTHLFAVIEPVPVAVRQVKLVGAASSLLLLLGQPLQHTVELLPARPLEEAFGWDT